MILSGLNPYEIVTPYLEEDLEQLQFIQSADVLYIFHEDYPPAKLIRNDHTDWDYVELYLSVSSDFNDYVTNGDFNDNLTGWTNYSAGGATVTVVAWGGDPTEKYCVLTPGVGGTAHFGQSITSVIGQQQTLTFDVSGNPLWIRVGTVENIGSDLVAGTWFDPGIGHTISFTPTAVVSWINFIQNTGLIANVDNVSVKGGASRGFYSAGLYPSCGTFFEQRLAIAGFINEPQTVYLSVSADYENFKTDATADDGAIAYTLVQEKVDRIRWMIGQEFLAIGTAGGLWKLGASTATDPLTQANVSAKKQGIVGSANIQPQILGDAIVWITRSGRVLRQFVYDWQQDKFVTPDMTRIARHITRGSTSALSGIVMMDFQVEPVQILWCVRRDGSLIGVTYETQENVYAWFRVPTDGVFESIAIIHEDNDEDQVWVSVKRTIQGVDRWYIEYFMPHDFFSQIKDCFFVHSGLSYNGQTAINITGITTTNPPVVTAIGHSFVNTDKVRIYNVLGMTQVNQGKTTAYTVAGAVAGVSFQLSGIDATGWTAYTSGGSVAKVKNSFDDLDHLAGKVVDIFIDGAVHPQKTVSAGGSITLDWYGNRISAGLHYHSILEPMKLHAGASLGTSRGKKQKISGLTACFYETLGGKYGPDQDTLKSIPFGTGATPALHTEDKQLEFEGDWKEEATITIIQDQPLPMTVLGIVPEINVNER